jgi:hypothetical protein
MGYDAGTVRPRLRVLALLLAAPACGAPAVGDSHTNAPVSADPTPAAPAAGAASAPFDGCTATYTAVLGWSFDCGNTKVLTREGEEPDSLLRGARTSMRGAFSGSVEERFEPVTIAGAQRRGLHLIMKTRGQLVALGTAAIVELDSQPMRLVACLATSDLDSQMRCQRQLDLLGSADYGSLPPQGARIKARPGPTIAGRAFDAPASCKIAGNDRAGIVDCGDATLGWAEPADPKTVNITRDAAVDDLIHHMHEKFPGDPAPARSTIGCRIEGVPSKCLVARWSSFRITAGAATVRGHAIAAWCMVREGIGPVICEDTVRAGN